MDSARWHRIQTLFHETADLPEHQRHTFLKDACHGDDALMADVLAMLEEDSRGASLLDGDVAHLAHRIVGNGASPSFATKDFGPYHIGSVLGEGGMGVVYLAQRDDLGSLVAIKILRDAWLSPARRERFLSEQRTLAQLNHPSIARLYHGVPSARVSAASRRPTESSIHRAALRRGYPRRRNPVVRHGICRWPPADRVLLAARVIHPAAPPIVSFRVRGRATRPPACHHPPRPEAVEHPRETRRNRQAARLWHCQTTRRPGQAGGSDPHGLTADDAGLRCARAGSRRPGGGLHGCLLAGSDPL